MHKKNELILYLILYLLCSLALTDVVGSTGIYFLFNIALIASIGILFFGARYFIYPKIIERKFRSLIVLAAALLFSYFVIAFIYASTGSSGFKAEYLIHIITIKKIIPFLIVSSLIGLWPLLKLKNARAAIRKIAPVALIVSVIIVAGFAGKYILDMSYNGSDQINFISDEPRNLDDILKRKPFKNKVVYIDLWFSSCSPCIEEFMALPALKEEVKNEKITYLYLARETSHPNHRQRWKNAIRKYNLTGWHVYMNDELEENVWKLIETNYDLDYRSYPHYLLVDPSGAIISYNAKKPTEKDALIRIIHRQVGRAGRDS